MEKLRAELAETFSDDRYLEMDKYDLAAVYYRLAQRVRGASAHVVCGL